MTPSAISNRKLDRIGITGLFTITPLIYDRCLSKADDDTENFMVAMK